MTVTTSAGPAVRAIESAVNGCFELKYPVTTDHRGTFVKVFNKTLFQNLSLEAEYSEAFYSVSTSRVLRGMHFQRPPADHAKLVYCLTGSVLDVSLDLRRGSSTFGQCVAFELNAETHTAVYLPRGMAHGFYVLDGPATVVYHVSSEYSPHNDTGINWNSFGFDWPDKCPLLSKRDSELVPFSEFDTPFRYAFPEVGKL